MKHLTMIIILLVLVGGLFAQVLVPPVVSNLSVNQRTDGSKLVDIYYDLYDANDDLCEVSLLISLNGGLTFNYTPDDVNLSGDIGENIQAGENKHIIWNAGNETQVFSANNYKIRVNAEDNTYLQIATPVISPESGSYDGLQTITVSCATPEVDIYYTLDGNSPNQASSLYSEAFTLDTSTIVKARAYKEDWIDSEIASANYVIDTGSVQITVVGEVFSQSW